MPEIDFISSLHTATKRDYQARATADKAECAEVACQFGYDYWDGDRRYGYGGYSYDGRWRPVARKLAEHYKLKSGNRVLDVGCEKGFLLYELSQVIQGLEVYGIDISEHAIKEAKSEIAKFLRVGGAHHLPYPNQKFHLVLSINTLHNLYLPQLLQALREIRRVSTRDAYIVMDAYRNEREKVNLMYWQLTCRQFNTPQEWEYIFNLAGYKGDWSYVIYE